MRSIVNGKTIYNVYDASGKLVHVHKKAGAGQALERSDYVTAGGKAIARDVLVGRPITPSLTIWARQLRR